MIDLMASEGESSWRAASSMFVFTIRSSVLSRFNGIVGCEGVKQ